MREKFEGHINYNKEESEEETSSVNNKEEDKELKWKAENKYKGENEEEEYIKLSINSLTPRQKFFIKDENGNLIEGWHIMKVGRGRDITFFTGDGEKKTVPWNTEVYLPILPEQKKLKEVSLNTLKPGDEFVFNGKKGRVLMKYGQGRPGEKDISVLFKGEDEKKFMPWGTKVIF